MKMLDTPILESNPKTATFDNSQLEEYARELCRVYPINSKILLVQTLQFQLDAMNVGVARNKGYYAYPPAGLQNLIKVLLARNIEIEILDLNYELLKRINEDETFNYLDWLDILDKRIEKFEPSIIGVSAICIAANIFKPYHPLTEVLRHLKKRNRAVVIAGGTIATDEFESYLNHDLCHFVIKGEGENKINFLLDYFLAEPRSAMATSGVAFKYKNQILESQGQKDTVRVAENLIETYKYVPIENYHNVGSLNPFSRMVGQEKPFAGIQLNRGCRADCKFCGVTKFMGTGVRQTAVDALFEEMVYLVKERGIRHFELLDDDFLGPASLRDGAAKLLTKMCSLKQEYGITWSAGNGLIAASISDEMMKLINDSGCAGFRIGLESGNQGILKKMRKPASVKSSILFASKVNKYIGMFVSANYIIGLYGEETFGEMMDTFKLSCELDLDWSSYSTFQFTSKTTSKVENLKDDQKGATECIPPKDFANREMQMNQGILVGMDIFNIPYNHIPSRDQISEIWFVFNLLSNFIYNKNLKPEGNPRKLVSWIGALQVTYPKNAYMPLFTGLGYVLLDEKELALKQLSKTRDCIANSDYWKHRFAQFDLMKLVENFPETAHDVYEMLNILQNNSRVPWQGNKNQFLET